jgi:flagellar export protein FliJ
MSYKKIKNKLLQIERILLLKFDQEKKANEEMQKIKRKMFEEEEKLNMLIARKNDLANNNNSTSIRELQQKSIFITNLNEASEHQKRVISGFERVFNEKHLLWSRAYQDLSAFKKLKENILKELVKLDDKKEQKTLDDLNLLKAHKNRKDVNNTYG